VEPRPVREVMPQRVEMPAYPAYTEEQVRKTTEQDFERSSEGVDKDSSFIDPNDPETMQQIQNQQALFVQQRQRQQRQSILEEQRRQEVSAIPVRSGRVPPHVQAAKAQEAIQLGTTSSADGQEMPVFQLPTQTLSGRGAPTKTTPPDLNPKPQGNVNPNFRPVR
jgi:hypothetical protein